MSAPNGAGDLPRRLLLKVFGHEDFRPGQEDVIAAAVAGRDVLAVMPTSGGKSLCYQVPALMGEGLTVVVSPLVSLIKDQIDALRARVECIERNEATSKGRIGVLGSIFGSAAGAAVTLLTLLLALACPSRGAAVPPRTTFVANVEQCPRLAPRAPTTVHDLRPDDFEVIMSFGDSLTAGTYAKGLRLCFECAFSPC